jgi:hypothetical protein
MVKSVLAALLLAGAGFGCATPYKAVGQDTQGNAWVVRFAHMGSQLYHCTATPVPTCTEVTNMPAAGGASGGGGK